MNATNNLSSGAIEEISVSVDVDLQSGLSSELELPSPDQFQQWVECALDAVLDEPSAACYEIAIRVVDSNEMQRANSDFRGKDSTTNVLSFPVELDRDVLLSLSHVPLGDLLICHDVVQQEAKQQDKTEQQHYAHLTVHGVLHLNGFDHENDSDAETMEALERQILAKLGFPDPYRAL